jgi:hypothetical protein
MSVPAATFQLSIIARRSHRLASHETPGVPMPCWDDFDYDRSVQRAWSAFQRRLSGYVAEMKVDDLLTLDSTFDTDPDDVARCVQFFARASRVTDPSPRWRRHVSPTWGGIHCGEGD